MTSYVTQRSHNVRVYTNKYVKANAYLHVIYAGVYVYVFCVFMCSNISQ